jgi:hypothetical protein
MLSGRFPEMPLFSHDWIEGAHVRVGLASDIQRHDDQSNVPEIVTCERTLYRGSDQLLHHPEEIADLVFHGIAVEGTPEFIERFIPELNGIRIELDKRFEALHILTVDLKIIEQEREIVGFRILDTEERQPGFEGLFHGLLGMEPKDFVSKHLAIGHAV